MASPRWHEDRGELHGITVVVETEADEIFVGRCDTAEGDQIVLLDADMHRDEEDGVSRQEYLERAAQVGVWKRFDRLAIPRRRVTSIRRLAEL